MALRFLPVLLFYCFGTLWAQTNAVEPLPLSLAAAEDYAAANAYAVQDRDLEVAKARQTIRETAAIGFPQISGSFGFSWNTQIPEQPIPAQFFDPNAEPGEFTTVAFGVEFQNQAALNVNQLLVDATYFVALRATRVFKETKALEREEAVINARKNAAQAYYAVLVARRSTEIALDNLRNAQDNFRETKALFDNGFLEKQDADQLALLVNNLENAYENAKSQSELALLSLKYALGVPQERPIVLTDRLEDLLLPEALVEQLNDERFDLERHITYRALLSQEKGAQLQLANERAAYYPKLSGFINHSQSNFSQDFEQSFSFNTFWIPGTTLGLSLNWNLFNGFARDARVQKAKLDLERLEVAKRSTAHQLNLDYRRALSTFNYRYANYQNQKENLALSREISRQTEIKYSEGLATSLDYIQAENQFLQTQYNYFQTMLNLLNSKEDLENALGK